MKRVFNFLVAFFLVLIFASASYAQTASKIMGTGLSAEKAVVIAERSANVVGLKVTNSTGTPVAGITPASGNAVIGGTLAVTGASTLTGGVVGLKVTNSTLTPVAGITPASGNIATSGSISGAAISGSTVTGTGALTGAGLVVTNASTTPMAGITPASGNIVTGGTLAVTGASTLTGAVAANGGITFPADKGLGYTAYVPTAIATPVAGTNDLKLGLNVYPTAAANAAAILPTPAAAGVTVRLFNSGPNAVRAKAGGTNTINGSSAGAYIPIATLQEIICTANSATNWGCLQGSVPTPAGP